MPRRIYNRSQDGIHRCTVRAKMRLEQEEERLLNQLAKEDEVPVQKYLDRLLSDAFASRVLRQEDAKSYSEEDDCNHT